MLHPNLGFTKKKNNLPGPLHWHRNGSMRDATRPRRLEDRPDVEWPAIFVVKMGDEPDVEVIIISNNLIFKQPHIMVLFEILGMVTMI